MARARQTLFWFNRGPGGVAPWNGGSIGNVDRHDFGSDGPLFPKGAAKPVDCGDLPISDESRCCSPRVCGGLLTGAWFGAREQIEGCVSDVRHILPARRRCGSLRGSVRKSRPAPSAKIPKSWSSCESLVSAGNLQAQLLEACHRLSGIVSCLAVALLHRIRSDRRIDETAHVRRPTAHRPKARSHAALVEEPVGPDA